MEDRAAEFMPSLYVSLGGSYERMGDAVEAKKYFDLAAELGLVHQPHRRPAQYRLTRASSGRRRPG